MVRKEANSIAFSPFHHVSFQHISTLPVLATAFYTSHAKEALVVRQGLHGPLEIGDVQDRLQIENGTCNEGGQWMSILHRLRTEELGDEIHLLYSSPGEVKHGQTTSLLRIPKSWADDGDII